MQTKRKQVLLFAVFFVLYEMNVYLSNDMIMPGMVKVIQQFNAPVSNVAASLSFYIIGGCLLQVFLGPITDLIGKRKVLLFGNMLFLVATAVIPFSNDINQFLAARLFQGMGMCFIFIGYAMIHELFNDSEAVKLTSIVTNIATMAPLLGPIIGSAITVNSAWEYVFIVSGLLGVITLIGLFKYMPQGKISRITLNTGEILHSYKRIYTNKNFTFGIITMALTLIPVISWVGLSPVIIMDKMHQSFTIYIIYQAIIFGGFILSSAIIQKIAGRFSFYSLIIIGSIVAFFGILIAAIFSYNGPVFVAGMCIYSIGVGLYNGSIVRIALMGTGESTSLSSAAMSLINSFILATGLEITNQLCNYFGYSLHSFSIINLLLGIVFFIFALNFAKNNRSREWNDTKIIID
jgi:DHA1 family multidrug/chloramphenicol efflux transport protein-like MFS transporter